MLLSTLLIAPILGVHKNSCSIKKSDRILDSKTITIKKQNKISKKYDLRGPIRDPQLVLILKIGKTWGPVESRKNSLNLISVLDKQSFEYGALIYKRFKEISFKTLAFLGLLFWSISGMLAGHSLIETVTMDIPIKIDTLDPEMLYLSRKMIDLSREMIDLSREMEMDAVNWDYEMGLEIPFISDLDDLNFDIVDIP